MPTDRPKVVVLGSFDDLRSPDVRFLQEAARRGAVEVQEVVQKVRIAAAVDEKIEKVRYW